MDPEFARDLRERMSASLGSLNRVALELLAERPSILFPHDTSWPDIRRHSECVRETGTGSTCFGRRSEVDRLFDAVLCLWRPHARRLITRKEKVASPPDGFRHPSLVARSSRAIA